MIAMPSYDRNTSSFMDVTQRPLIAQRLDFILKN